jgi:hypothetical protein
MPKTPSLITFILLFFASGLFSSCLTAKKMDHYLALQYNNELPVPARKKNTDIIIISSVPSAVTAISNSNQKTSKFLPLLVYWQWEYKVNCELNPTIGIVRFTNAINSQANKDLKEKLNGRKLELKVEQMPISFAIVDKAHSIFLLLYAFGWEKVYRAPDTSDLVVSYQLTQGDTSIKTGKISIKNNAQNNGLRYFQSWKSAVREQLADNDVNITKMSQAFVDRLLEEL